MNTNLTQLLYFLKQSKNPEEFVCNLVTEKAGTNPFFANLLNLAKNNQRGDIEAIARNMMKEKGLDFDTEFAKFKQTLGFK